MTPIIPITPPHYPQLVLNIKIESIEYIEMDKLNDKKNDTTLITTKPKRKYIKKKDKMKGIIVSHTPITLIFD